MKWIVTYTDPQGKPYRQSVEAETREAAKMVVEKESPWAYDVEVKKDMNERP